MKKKVLIGIILGTILLAGLVVGCLFFFRHEHTEVITPEIAPTCISMGLTEGKYCSDCGKVLVHQQLVEKLPHTEVVDSAIPATCTDEGKTEGKHCSVCNTVTVLQETIAKIPHTPIYDNGVPATCTSIGVTNGSHCSVCNAVIEKQQIIAMIPHTEVVDAAVAATCTTTGLTEGKHCSVCNVIIVAQQEVSKIPHTEVVDVAVAATCTTTGLTEGKHCSVCNNVMVAQQEVSKIPHTEVIDDAVTATCTTTGLTEGKHCSVCNTVTVAQETTPVIDCVEGNWIIDEDPTNTTVGKKHTECTMCGKKIKEETIPMIDPGKPTYTVIWKNGDTVLETDEYVEQGTTPIYNGAQPTKAADNMYSYTFSGWSPEISAITSDVTYVAQFTSKLHEYTVIFYEDDGITELGRVVVEHGTTAIYPNTIPAKASTVELVYTFDKWVTEKDGTTEAELTNITANLSVYVKYSAAPRTYAVIFCDHEGTILLESNVEYGATATAPDAPSREGYRFTGWDKSYDNITEGITVRAQYIQQFTVLFLDYDNSVIATQLVDYHANATAPENPTRSNYRFTGWDVNFNNVTSNLTVKAQYIRQYKVIFKDYDGTVLKDVMVDEGSTTTAPATSDLEGYDFDRWDTDFSSVKSNLTVTATYRLKTYTVKFVMPDDTIIGSEQTIEHGFSAIAPQLPEFYLSGTGDSTKVYGFTNWDQSFNEVKSDLIIKAKYESDYTTPVMIIEFSQERNGDAKLYLYNHESITLNAIEFTIGYEADQGRISINSATVNSASPLWVENSDGSNNNQYVINNNEKTFTFAWSDANGKQFNWCSKIITFSFSTDGALVSQDTFKVVNCSAIVTVGNNANPQRAIPVIVYR